MDNPSPRPDRLLLKFAGGMIALGLGLAALLPPIDNGAGGGSTKLRRENCTSNLRQIGLSMALYADLYEGRLPMDAAEPTLLGSLRLLSNVTGSAKIFHCPNDSRAAGPFRFDDLTSTNLSYSYVPNLIWNWNPDSIVACDRIYTTKKGSPWPTTGNHKGEGGNVLYGDGHVEFKRVLPCDLKDQTGAEIVLSP